MFVETHETKRRRSGGARQCGSSGAGLFNQTLSTNIRLLWSRVVISHSFHKRPKGITVVSGRQWPAHRNLGDVSAKAPSTWRLQVLSPLSVRRDYLVFPELADTRSQVI